MDSTPVSNPKILVVLEDDSLFGILSYKLERQGFRVSRAVDGIEALDQMERETFDLLLIDILIQKLDGFQVMREIQQREKVNEPGAMIVISAREDEDDILNAFRLGCVDYVTIPFSINVLIARLYNALKHVRGTAQAG
ncbi:response regulator transcription factor [bacterium]|nr:response regulator transcription factor [bacterium]MCB1219177.1 response regulator transcription factor [bacterium]UNM09606.1 MAG: response regulator transcription factor [Planctomycetales bacterium]